MASISLTFSPSDDAEMLSSRGKTMFDCELSKLNFILNLILKI